MKIKIKLSSRPNEKDILSPERNGPFLEDTIIIDTETSEFEHQEKSGCVTVEFIEFDKKSIGERRPD